MIMVDVKKIIFVSGPSESGKSSGINYILSSFPKVKHLKIRDIFRALYEKSGSPLDYESWRAQQIATDLKKHWTDYLNLATSQNEDKPILIMDTLYNPQDAIILREILGNKLALLYVDAPLEDRIMREYNRLRTDSTHSDRKADLTLTFDDIAQRTSEKDKKKFSEGMLHYPELVITPNGQVLQNGEGTRLAYIIHNASSEIEFHRKLDLFINEIVTLD
jgi:hypothetical protein